MRKRERRLRKRRTLKRERRLRKRERRRERRLQRSLHTRDKVSLTVAELLRSVPERRRGDTGSSRRKR